MSHPPGPDPRRVNNTVTGEVSGTVVMAGTIHDGVHLHPPARPAVALPYRYGAVPVRAASFQHRSITTELAAAVDAGHTAVLTSDALASASVLSGLGGVGKTQLALDYAEAAWTAGELDLLVWISATSRDAIMSGYAGLALDLTGTDLDPEEGAQRLRSWLATTPARWLIVLDDVQSPRDLHRLWPPSTGRSRVLVTTRRRDAALRGYHRRLIDIDVFSQAEATRYLTAALAERPDLLDGAAELASALGYLPLALAQAATFMLDRDLSCAGYRKRLADRRHRLASLLPEDEGLPDEHRATTAATWSLSIEHANRLQPTGIAGPLLEVASLLAPNGIPVEVCTAAPVLSLLTDAAGRTVDTEQAREGLACLRRLSLITLDPDSGSTQRTVRVHALVQRATRDSLSETRLASLARAVADALVLVWPETRQNTALNQVLRANTDALNTAAGGCLWTSDGHPVLFRAGRSLGESGFVAQARDYFERLRGTATRRLGADHRDTLAIRRDLAIWRGQAGDLPGAMTDFERLVADRERVLGADHPDTLMTRCNLAKRRGQAGDPVGAITALEQLLVDHLRVLGADHPHTLIIRHELAHWRGQAGDLVGAVTEFERLVADRERVLGADHPDTLITRHTLANWRGQAGDPVGAIATLEQLLADQERALGADHPRTLNIRHELAHWRGQTGGPVGAVTEFERLVADRERVLGADHPDTLITRHTLANWRGQAGDPVGAVTEFEQLLADHLRVLGADHPHTLIIRGHLTQWREQLS